MAVASTHRGWLKKPAPGILAAVNNGAIGGAVAHGSNTALDGVLLGTPVTPALAVDSMVISNLVASGDLLLAANNGGNSQAWLWVDASAGTMTLYGAGTAALTISSTAVKSSLALSPLVTDGAALGSASLMWQDLFLASGAVINFDNGDVTLTHAANSLAIAGGDVTLASGFGINVGSTTQATISDGDGTTNLIPEVQALGVGTAFAGGALLLGTFNATNDRTVSPKLAFLKGAAATQVATTAVANDEVIGSIIAYGSDSGDFETPVAAIEFVVDDAGGPGASAIGGSIEFYTTADGGSTLTKALTLGADQSATFTGVINLPSGASINGTVSITVNNDSADVDFIVESNGNANMFTVDAALDAIGIGGVAVTSQTLTITNAALNATAGRILKLSGSVAAPNFGDGYGAMEVDITFSGTVAGTSAASSTWVNIAASAVPGANIITPRNDGIWLASGITATNAIMVIGGRLQYVPNDGADCSNIHLFDTNIYSNVLKSLFRVNTIVDMGGSTGAQTGNDYKVPLFYDVTANQLWYVNIYHS